MRFLGRPHPGKRFSAVITQVDDRRGRIQHTGEVVGVPPGLFGASPTLVIHQAGVRATPEGLLLTCEPVTWYTSIAPLDATSFDTIREVCAGMGGIGLGGSLMNMQIVAQLDHNALCCDTLKRNGSPCVIQADICRDESIMYLHQVQPHRRHVLTAGFPCQPFSTQGSQLAMSDRRSAVFFQVLKTAYLTSPSAMLLECVPGVANHMEIRQGLEDLAGLLDFQYVTEIMDLAQVWPCSRRRWWALMVPKYMDVNQVQTWQVGAQFSRVDTLISKWPLWPSDQESQLKLSEQELMLYHNPCFGQEERLLHQSRPAPTFLHSYGNGHGPCPCGCRRQGFSHYSLAHKGFRGICTVGTA